MVGRAGLPSLKRTRPEQSEGGQAHFSDNHHANILKLEKLPPALPLHSMVGRTERFSNTHPNNFNNLRAQKAHKSFYQT
jgi:hypothetical protein